MRADGVFKTKRNTYIIEKSDLELMVGFVWSTTSVVRFSVV